MAFSSHFSHFFLAFIFVLSSLQMTLGDTGAIGINYGRVANDLPSPVAALSGSGISVTVALPNEQLSSAAANESFTDTWVKTNIISYHPKTLIEAIAVGNEVFVDPKNTTPFLLPAMKNVYASLSKYDVASNIKVCSPVALSALQSSYPSSSGSFKSDLIEPVIKPMLSFLNQTDSYLMVNAYPFFAYIANTDTISLDYAMFRDNKGQTDPNNGLVYKSLFEAQIDAVFAAMNALGFNDLKMVISETGWPSNGDENEVGASTANAAAYNGNLVRRVLTGSGTPLRPEQPLNVYLFALFNENQKPGPTSEKNYGLFYPNEQKVYDIPLTLEGIKNEPKMNNGSKNQVAAPPSGEVSVSNAAQTWCIANGEAGEKKLQDALDYACGAGADCRPIEEGATCYDPNSVEAHASYAFNSYYQKNARKSGTCDFGGAAYLVTQPPKFGSCEFPTGY
ncbi:O-Glycosyl hydrolase family 17 protein [Abeliophyllum distichum]|uniref:glucan endo-1,3-beta-D-glucosidase n=1 Tax=Abeliophyllum distichum TaxID=126358 RepID=A0ABD1UFH9_9LAMI